MIILSVFQSEFMLVNYREGVDKLQIIIQTLF